MVRQAVTTIEALSRLFRSNRTVETRQQGNRVNPSVYVDTSDDGSITFIPDRDVDPFEVMVPLTSGTGYVEMDPGNDDRPVMLTTQSASFFNPVIYVNGWEEVLTGDRGQCWMVGTVPVRAKYDATGTTPAAGDCLGIKPSTLLLRPKYPGLYALTDGDTTEETVWVVRAPIMRAIAVLDGDLGHDGSATASMFLDTDTDSGHDETVYDAELIGSGKEIVAGAVLIVELFSDGKIYVTQSDTCPTTV